MEKGVHSKIVSWSVLDKETVAKQKKRKTDFQYWGPTPKEARQVAAAKNKSLISKTMSIQQAVEKYVKDGMHIGFGGFVNTRVPTAILWHIIKKGVKDLTLTFTSHSICPEWIAGAMLVYPEHVSIKRVELAWWGYEIIGIAPLLRYLAANEMIEMDDYTNYGIAARFKAGAMGIPFIPVRENGGSDMELVNRGTMIQCPFSGENTYILPACNPDLGIVHVQAADKYGNARIFGPLCTCPEISQAAAHTILSCETIIDNTAIRRYPNLTEIPYLVVDAVCEQKFGSWPGAVYGEYWFDMKQFLNFRSLCEEFHKTGNKDKLKAYYDEYFFGCDTWDDLIAKILSPDQLVDLRKQDGGQPVILS